MSTAYVVCTAMPPTKGHVRLIEFAALTSDITNVLVMTQPGEPFPRERVNALKDHFCHDDGIRFYNVHRVLPQDPETPGFRELWRDIMVSEYDCQPGDTIVSSESYGIWLSEVTGATFIPYDPERALTPTKATDVRNDPVSNFDLIAEEFQPYLRINVVLFGAESVGKTTLSRDLATRLNGHCFFEYARPYLEMVGPEISRDSMTAIWRGQKALETQSHRFFDKPYAFYDTDLHSTVGYWAMPHWADHLGPVPQGLIDDAMAHRSDIYLIPRSNIPFEEDPIRYGGDKREASDAYWIAVAEQYGLNYVLLESPDRNERIYEAIDALRPLERKMRHSLTYDRQGF